MTIVVNENNGVVGDPEVFVSRPGLSWPAILAGATVMLALTLLLLALGTGLGLSIVSPWSNSGVSGTTFKIATGLYFVVIAMISCGLGGHITGRLRQRYVAMHDNEVYFRDTANGLVAWAVATVIGVAFLASASTFITGATVATTAGAATQQASLASPYVDRLLRPDAAAPAPTTGNNIGDAREEMTRLLTPGFRDRTDVSADDRTYLAQVVARNTGLSQPDAQRRVDAVLTQAKADLDAARKAAVQLALWLTAFFLLGGFSAAIAAAEGGALRDRNWGVATSA